jgi:hypothetical protein
MNIWLDPPFNMLISGITNCGKTHYVLDLIEKHYIKLFDYIIFFAQHILLILHIIENWIEKNEFIFVIDMDYADLDTLLEKTIEVFSYINMKNKCNTLFIIDDCANLHDSKMKESAICKLAFHGRHHNISTWIITQKYNAIVKDFRDNIRMLILFFDKDKIQWNWH